MVIIILMVNVTKLSIILLIEMRQHLAEVESTTSGTWDAWSTAVPLCDDLVVRRVYTWHRCSRFEPFLAQILKNQRLLHSVNSSSLPIESEFESRLEDFHSTLGWQDFAQHGSNRQTDELGKKQIYQGQGSQRQVVLKWQLSEKHSIKPHIVRRLSKPLPALYELFILVKLVRLK